MAAGDELISVAEAAASTGYTPQHVTRLIRSGKLWGRRVGPVWLTSRAAAEAYRRSAPKPGPKPGRPDQ